MATTAKAAAIARELVDVWQKKVATTLPVLVESLDTDGNPVITMSAIASPVAGGKVVVVRVKPMTWTAYDVIGHVSPVFAQHVIQVCTEANYAGSDNGVADILTPVELLPVWAEIARRGCMMEWYVCSNTTLPSTAQMTSGNLVKADKDLYWNALKSQ
jgi:hypothetical protein